MKKKNKLLFFHDEATKLLIQMNKKTYIVKKKRKL